MRGKRVGKIWNLTVASKDVIIECTNWAKRAGKLFKLNCNERSERKIFAKFCTFPPNSSKKRSDYLFSFQNRTSYFKHFQGQNIYFQKVPAPPPLESNGRPLKFLKMNILVQISFQIIPQTTWWKEALKFVNPVPLWTIQIIIYEYKNHSYAVDPLSFCLVYCRSQWYLCSAFL